MYLLYHPIENVFNLQNWCHTVTRDRLSDAGTRHDNLAAFLHGTPWFTEIFPVYRQDTEAQKKGRAKSLETFFFFLYLKWIGFYVFCVNSRDYGVQAKHFFEMWICIIDTYLYKIIKLYFLNVI